MDNEESEILNSNVGWLKHLITICTIFCPSAGDELVFVNPLISREDQGKKVKPSY